MTHVYMHAFLIFQTCKIWFTSQTDASQHYAGKKHLKAAFGTKIK